MTNFWNFFLTFYILCGIIILTIRKEVENMKKILFLLVLLTSCTGFEDGIKDLESDTFGLEREATVYSYTGQKIASYSGNSVRIDYS